jgi:S-adenosylmethionine hydrolase
LAREHVLQVRTLDNPAFFRLPVSHTFHGRDIFAPVAAHLAREPRAFSKVGALQDGYARLAISEPAIDEGVIVGQIVYFDRFGNGITNIPVQAAFPLELWEMRLGRRRIELHRFYSEAASGVLSGICGSTGFLEVAVHDGSAAQAAKLRVGDSVRLVRIHASKVR